MSANAPCPICRDPECCIWGDAQAHGINPKPRLTGGELLRRARANLSPEVLAAARRLAANGPRGEPRGIPQRLADEAARAFGDEL